MKLTFLGTGSAFTIGNANYHSNMLLETATHQRLLIDCGSDARFSLHELGLSHRAIENVYISHLHADHAGGLEWLSFATKFDPACSKPNLYVSDLIADDLWNKVLAGGLSSLQGIIADLDTYFNVNRIGENSSFVWADTEIRLIQTIHIMSGYKIMPSFGLLFKTNGLTVFITTDTQFSPHQLTEFYRVADVIFHDCETTPHKSGVHSHYSDLLTLDPEFRKKMWLYHYNPGELPNAKKDGFRGFAKKGQIFDFAKPKTL